ncbi:MAG: hypothetical protein HRT90_06845, partial [Candidatus Margulisbacteria bacterium]|nr:hypothetical protein [Candidatus Margulisiibacteriota bacterium]
MEPSKVKSLVESAEKKKVKAIGMIMSQLSSEKAVMRKFSALFLGSMSIRTLQSLAKSEIVKFLQDRFDYFEKAIEKGGDFRAFNPLGSQSWLEKKQIIEMVNPDAPHLLITLEGLFKKYNLKITRKLHPIMLTKMDSKGKLEDILPLAPHQRLYSYIYLE